MSKNSAAKKARRKRRLSARNEAWLPDEVHADVRGVARIANEIIPRGWEFDREYSTEDFVTWYYPPSGIAIDDDTDDDTDVETVTRIWLTDPTQPHVILVGAAEGDTDHRFTFEELLGNLDAVEAYRVGDLAPSF